MHYFMHENTRLKLVLHGPFIDHVFLLSVVFSLLLVSLTFHNLLGLFQLKSKATRLQNVLSLRLQDGGRHRLYFVLHRHRCQ